MPVFAYMKNKIAEIVNIFRVVILEIFLKFFGSPCKFFRNLFFGQTIPEKKIINISREGGHVFFGYYDITPFSQDDKVLLAMQTSLVGRAPGAGDEAEVGFYHINTPQRDFTSIGKTNTWCWQQGCRLQWYGGGKNQIIYNCMVDGEYGAIIKEIPSGNEIKTIKKPLYALSKNGKWGLSLDFSRLQRLRPGYGYGVLPDRSAEDLILNDNGIKLVNLKTNETHQLFSLKDISEIEPRDSMTDAEHYFNHLMFNPSGNKFLFFHLWVKSGKRHSRMFVADRNGENIKLLNNSGSVSHYNWISEDKIILFSLLEEKNKYMYAIFNSLNGKINYFGKNVPKKDGHPTSLKNNEIFITDTYPDRLFQRSVLSYNIKKDKTEVLARFEDPRNFAGEFRCDLHPRISNNEKMICVDRVIDNRRSISLIPLDIENS